MDFFTSDLHFFHKRMLDFRPFGSLEDMHETLITRWNTAVTETDRVWVLGDFAMGLRGNSRVKQGMVEGILSRLNGEKHLVRGNHDHSETRKASGWASVQDYKRLVVGKGTDPLELLHFPMRSWRDMHRGAIHLHGHTHGSLRDDMGVLNSTAVGKMLDVGTDVHDFAPISLTEVRARMARREINSVDHHTR